MEAMTKILKPQTILTPSGDELVVLSRAEYDALRARADAAPANEDEDIARIVGRTNGEAAFPTELWERIEAGEHPVRVFREFRDITQLHLAMKIDVAQSTIAAIETNKRRGTVDLYIALAKALDVPLDALVER
jgi:DNA-binding XRE family transcriptional regulator